LARWIMEGRYIGEFRSVRKYVLNDVDLRLERGVYALVGPNGSGKTTLLRLLAGVIAPERGQVSIYGVDPFRDHRVRRLISYSAAKPLAEGLERVIDYLSLYFNVAPPEMRRMTPGEALKALGVEGLGGRRIYELSEGQRRRVELAKLLLTRARVVLVDEPTTFLDAESRARVVELLRELAGASELLVVSTHDGEVLDSLRPKIVRLEGGRVVGVVDYEESGGVREAETVYYVKGVVVSRGVAPLEKIKSVRGVRKAVYNIRFEKLLEKLGFKADNVSITVIPYSEAARIARESGIPLYTYSNVEVEAEIEVEVTESGLPLLVGFLERETVIVDLQISARGSSVAGVG